MVGDDDVYAELDRLIGDRLGQVDREQHPADRARLERFDEQADIVPIRGVLQGRNLLQAVQQHYQVWLCIVHALFIPACRSSVKPFFLNSRLHSKKKKEYLCNIERRKSIVKESGMDIGGRFAGGAGEF